MLEAYADIVFRLWKAAEGESQEEIENDFLQTLVDGSIHASTTSFAASIRRILGGFITQRTTDGVEKLIFNLTEPVVFRSLQVANSNVRQNALHLLIDAFFIVYFLRCYRRTHRSLSQFQSILSKSQIAVTCFAYQENRSEKVRRVFVQFDFNRDDNEAASSLKTNSLALEEVFSHGR
ncbi:hypothetical protein L2E82_50907 [Cichorium intybus]|nr:hypothetical protein L2E82_50907 [Cichorium intybus]